MRETIKKISAPVILGLFIQTLSYASLAYPQARPVPYTPFDHKIQTALKIELGSVVQNIESGSIQKESIENLFFRAQRFRYVNEGRKDYWQSPQETELRGAGDCEDKAIWLFKKLKENGYYNVFLIIGKYRSVDPQYHVWVSVSDRQGNTLLLDPATQKRPWSLLAVREGLYRPLYSFDGTQSYKY